MISREEIDRLAELAKLDLSEEERDRFSSEIGQILDYIDEIGSAQVTGESSFVNVNTMREDRVTNAPGSFTADIVQNMPDSEDQFLKIHKVLGGDE